MHGQGRLCPVPVDTQERRLWAPEGTNSRSAVNVAILVLIGAYTHPTTATSTTVPMRASIFRWSGLGRVIVEKVKILDKMSHYLWLVVQEC